MERQYMSGYKGGAFDTWIPDSYTYTDFINDLQTAAPLVSCMEAKPEYRDFADMLLTFLTNNEQITSAYGRITAYAERNNFDEVYGDWVNGE